MTALFCRNPTTSDAGTVTVENMGLAGVTVRLSGMAEGQFVTESDGQYTFTGLRAGRYMVEISGFDSDEVGFGSTSAAATVGVGETKVINPFDGTYIRTASIQGQVSVDGVGLAGVTVTMAGDAEDTDVTREGGLYAFSKLKAGTYTVAISGYDTDDYEFKSTSETVTIATGEPANIPFEGTLLRTSGISGRVSLDDGTGLDNVEVTLAGAAEGTRTTKDGGQYAFAGLAEGTYVVSMTNPDEVAYRFEKMSHTVVLGDAESVIRNFDGTHTRDATISGMLFLDEAPKDGMYTANEPAFAHAGIPIALQGPGVNDLDGTVTLPDGSYAFEGKVAGDYRVLVNMTEEVATALATAGFAFGGRATGEVVTVAPGGTASANFAFNITHQTIGVGAVMGNAEMVSDPPLPVGGVTLALFPTAQDAEAGTNELGKLPIPTMTGETGMAAFQFARADDTSPGSDDTDNIVFVKVVDAGHEDLMVSDGDVIEVQYPGIARVHGAPTTVRFQNVAVNFQFWIKNDADARGGDVLVDGWHTDVYMGEVTDESMPLMMPDPDDDTKMVNLTMPSESSEDDDGMQGRVMVSYRVTPDQLPATFSAALSPDTDDWQQPEAMGETWEPVGDGLTYEHTGFELPALNTHEVNDLNLNPKFGQDPARFTFTTQKLTVGVYRETDDEPGFTNYQSKVAGGDQRPHKDVAAEMSVSVMVDASGRRGLEVYNEWDHDRDPDTDAIDATITGLTGGMATFVNLPADMEFTVQLNEGSDRVAVGGPDSRSDRVQAYDDDLELGMSVGAFGDDSGAGPEVRLCPLSSSSEDDMCSTFAYQWTSGSADGKITRRGAGVASATVSLDPITDNHSPDESTKTSKASATKGNYSFSGVQDGEYWVRTPATADSKADSARFALYHDETEDDDADDGITGNPATYTKNFDVTALRLEIKGFVANDGQEGDNEDPDLDQIVRGDEAVAGIELELLTITKVSSNKKDTTFKVHQTTETEDDGSYAFSDVVEGSAYYVRATGTGEYHAAEASAMDGFSRKVAADEYPAAEEGDFKLPYWDYNAGMTVNTAVTVSNATGTVSASFVNFALLYVDGSISGRVREASGNPGNITIELIRCDTYDAGDAECATYDRDNSPTETRETERNGTWEFNDLLEGWYEVYVGEAGYLAADIDDDGKIDDDGGTTAPDMHTGLVKGRRDLAAGNNFYLYDNGLDDDDDLGSDGVVIEGTTDPDEDPEELTSSSDVITWASKNVTVTPDINRDATFAATTESRGTRPWPQSTGVATVEPDYNETGSDDEGEVKATEITVSVTAENGYNDTDYTYMVYRAAPVGNTLIAGDFSVEAPANGVIREDLGIVDQFTINVAEAATELDFTVTLEDSDKQALLVEMGGDEVEASDRKRTDGAHESRYELTFVASRAITVDLTVTSEDEVDRLYQLVVRRGAAPGNNPATGKPTISGTAQVGEKLTADASGIADADGMTNATPAYQWISNDSDIAGATSMTYDPVADDVGNTLKVEVSFTDDAGFAEAVTSDATAAVVEADAPTVPMVTLGLSSSRIAEAGGEATVTASLSEAHTAEVVVTVAAAAGDDSEATDFTLSATTTLTIPMGQTSSTETDVTITANPDDDADDETVTVSGTVDAAAATAGIMNPADESLTITDDEEVPGAPQNVKVLSAVSGALTLSWDGPRVHGSSTVNAYEHQMRPVGSNTDPADDEWTALNTLTTLEAEFASLTDGLEYQLWVRAKNTGGAGQAVRVTGTPWPQITTVAADPTEIAETENADANTVDESTLTVTVGGSAVNAFDVMITATATVPDDGDVTDDDSDPDPVDVPVTFDAEATIAIGQTTAEVTVTAIGNMTDNPNATVTFVASLVPAETADRVDRDDAATIPSTHQATLTVNDDDELAGAVASINASTGAGAGELVVTWTPPSDLGTVDGDAATVMRYEIRHAEGTDNTAFDDSDGDDIGGWTNAGDANARSRTLTGLTAGTTYAVQVRVVTAAGDGTVDDSGSTSSAAAGS